MTPSSLGLVAAALLASTALALPAHGDPAGAGGGKVPAVIQAVPAGDETVPITHTGDAADDPAIWVHPTAPAQSLIIGNDKKGALETYNLDGSLQQRITTGVRFWGNVDVRQGVTIGTNTFDLAATTNSGIRFFGINAATRQLTNVTDSGGRLPLASPQVDGSCLYQQPGGDLYMFAVAIDTAPTAGKGLVRQYRVNDPDGDGLLQVTLVRSIKLATEAEGCAVDDATGALWVSEENKGIWRYSASPTGGSAGTLVDKVGPDGNLVYDVEGVTVVDKYVIVSAQNGANGAKSYFTVYNRLTNAYVKAFRIVASGAADGCQRTDGITAYAGNLGPSYPQGLFVCQDNGNTAPGVGNQDFKLTRLDSILSLG